MIETQRLWILQTRTEIDRISGFVQNWTLENNFKEEKKSKTLLRIELACQIIGVKGGAFPLEFSVLHAFWELNLKQVLVKFRARFETRKLNLYDIRSTRQVQRRDQAICLCPINRTTLTGQPDRGKPLCMFLVSTFRASDRNFYKQFWDMFYNLHVLGSKMVILEKC